VGEGAVTIVDGRTMSTNVAEIADHATPELIDVRLHLLPAGSRYALPGADGEDARRIDARRIDARRIPPPLLEFLENITKRNPIS
jgi:cyanophycinase